MNILIVSATKAEIAPFLNEGALDSGAFVPGIPEEVFLKGTAPAQGTAVYVLVTGVGTPATIYHLTKALQKYTYDLVINAGIAGSFDRALPLGAVVQVVSDSFADLGAESGAEDGEDFLDIFRLGMTGAETPPFKNGKLVNDFRHPGWQEAEGLTVNTVHGKESSIEAIRSRLPAITESMEGAGFFYVCMSEGIKCLQLRAISNYVEKRNRENWNIPLAVKELSAALTRIVEEYSSSPADDAD
ncbi:futalosine hydrolase [Anseongella ginsenosidimutans]|uniref:Futalosine hydrolase n=1 Tax=Anseongella ginsenosidimutans TaxID=496056 RepID=A0A4R3KUV4_9SPHI|nr:futalosine hydrolase [Anseongella ginsenosidimutans]QEC51526.1 futalosine hydrolase [Anseongella ginsenosidimutans]TCS88841.1 futalosine hydrolase [Anseongella ginsenosidimutans]